MEQPSPYSDKTSGHRCPVPGCFVYHRDGSRACVSCDPKVREIALLERAQESRPACETCNDSGEVPDLCGCCEAPCPDCRPGSPWERSTPILPPPPSRFSSAELDMLSRSLEASRGVLIDVEGDPLKARDFVPIDASFPNVPVRPWRGALRRAISRFVRKFFHA